MAQSIVTPSVPGASAQHRARKLLTVVGLRVGQVGLVAAVVYGWHWITASGTVSTFVAGSPAGAWNRLQELFASGEILGHTAITLAASFGGYLLGLVVGAAIGVACGIFPTFGQIVDPFVAFWNGFPRLVFYPFFAILLGFSVASRMAHVAFVIVFLIVINTAAGVRDVDPILVDNGMVIGAKRRHLLIDTYLPAAVVWIISSARYSFGIALQAALVAEFIGASSGLGYLVLLGQNRFDINYIWAGTAVVVAVAVMVDVVLAAVERRLTRWRG